MATKAPYQATSAPSPTNRLNDNGALWYHCRREARDIKASFSVSRRSLIGGSFAAVFNNAIRKIFFSIFDEHLQVQGYNVVSFDKHWMSFIIS